MPEFAVSTNPVNFQVNGSLVMFVVSAVGPQGPSGGGGSSGNLRVITASGNVTVSITDNTLIIDKAAPASTTVILPANPATNQQLIIKDGAGNANTYNITINGNGNTMDGGSSYVIGGAYGSVQMIWTGIQWSITG